MSKSIPGSDHFRIDKFNTGRIKSCFECRERKRKCSREYPSCAYCSKHNYNCIYLSNDPGPTERHAKLLIDLKSGKTNENSNSTQTKIYSSPISTLSFSPTDKRKGNISSTTSTPNQENSTSKDFTTIEIINHNLQIPYNNKDEITHNETSFKHFNKEKLNSLKQQTEHLKSLRPNVVDPSVDNSNSKNNFNVKIFNGNPFTRPELRVGSAFTKILNSSLNLQSNDIIVDLNLLSSFIPNRLESDILMDRYRSSVHPVIPILDLLSFFPLYEKFWNRQEKMNLSFYIILFTIFYASSVSLFEETCVNDKNANTEDSIKSMKYFVGAAEIALSMNNFPQNLSIVSLQAATILYSIVRNDCRTDDYISISSLVRYSQLIELNRDPLTYHKLTDTKEIQTRRLLWWQIYYLDCSTSLSTRLPPLIQQGEYDTQLPNEFKQYFNGQFKLDQAITFSNGRFRWIETCNKIVRASFNVKPLSDQELLRLSKDIENLSFCCSSLIQRMSDPINIMPSEEQFVKFASSVLSTFADRCFILLEILFSSQKREIPTSELISHDKGTYLNRAVEISSISNLEIIFLKEEIYEKQMHLLQEFMNYGSMPRNAIFVWEIRKFQPIQTLLSLLRGLIHDIYEKKIAISNLRIRKRAEIIDNAFSKLDYLSEHTTQLCQQRWKMLKTLKELTWDTLFSNHKTTNNLVVPDNNIIPNISYDLNSNVNFISDKDWDEIYEELADIHSVIDDNLNLKAWDDASGHFL